MRRSLLIEVEARSHTLPHLSHSATRAVSAVGLLLVAYVAWSSFCKVSILSDGVVHAVAPGTPATQLNVIPRSRIGSSFITSHPWLDVKRLQSESQCRPLAVHAEMPGTSQQSSGLDLPGGLNRVPLPREIRYLFYNDVAESIVNAFAANRTRTKVSITIPETDTSGDVYRVGTMLEMVRHAVLALTKDGKRVRVCVQDKMGEGRRKGLPIVLNGVKKLCELMDWGDSVDFVSIDFINKDAPKPDDDAFILIQPQNINGASVLPVLQEMMEVVGDRPVVMINPMLTDIPSAGGVMSYRGRKERIEYANTWEEIYHFRLLIATWPYTYGIYGAVRGAYGCKWELYEKTGKFLDDTEKYTLEGRYDENPSGRKLLDNW